jgi:hypothetical protein
MFTPIRKEDKRVTPYEINKTFSVQYYGGVDTATDYDIMALHAITGSLIGNPGFQTSTSAVNTVSNSKGEVIKIYKEPLYRQLKLNFFEFAHSDNRLYQSPQPQHVLDSYHMPFGHPASSGSVPYEELGLRRIYNDVNVISIPQKIFGEGIKSGSIELTDYSNGSAVIVKDDGCGNLYDSAYESEFKAGTPTAEGSGSSLGVISYDHGLIMISSTGSYYENVAGGSNATGWKLDFDATRTVYEHEYTCMIPMEKYNGTMNISATKERSGSLTIPASVAADTDALRQILAPGEFAYKASGYNAAPAADNMVTHSFFAPYITTVGLYNDFGDLLAIAKTSRPIRNDPELALSFVIRFDI